MLQSIVHIDLADQDRQARGLHNVENILRSQEGSAVIEIICHGAGLGLVVRDKSAHGDLLTGLIQQRVVVAACENTMIEQGIAPADILPGVRIVPSGAVEVIQKQHDGYAYFKP